MPMDVDALARLVADLESLGELKVRQRLAMGSWGDPASDMRTHVEDWLRAKGTGREIDLASAAREAIGVAREANAIALSADSTARAALRTARQELIAAVIATIAAIVAAVVVIGK